MRWGGASERVSVLVALGGNEEGFREVLARVEVWWMLDGYGIGPSPVAPNRLAPSSSAVGPVPFTSRTESGGQNRPEPGNCGAPVQA